MAEAEDYTGPRCHSLIAAKTDPRGRQDLDVYRACTQTNKTCVTEQNPELLIFLIAVALMLVCLLLLTAFTVHEWDKDTRRRRGGGRQRVKDEEVDVKRKTRVRL